MYDSLPLVEVVELLAERYDEVTLLEILEINSTQLVERFMDRIEDDPEKFYSLLDSDSLEGYDVEE